MILLSLNIRGVGGTLKQASMRRVCRKVKSDVIFLHETLVDEEKARHLMLRLVPSWCICVVSSLRNLGGILVAWDPNKFLLTPSSCIGGIMLKGISLENKQDICFLNVYGPCVEKKLFWDRVALGGLLDSNNLILACDLNFTLGADEVRGATTQLDKLAEYFKDMMLEHHLIDLVPVEIVPTWRNSRSGRHSISKRPHRVIVLEILLTDVGRFCRWVDLPFVSDHAPVAVQFDFQPFPMEFPFKFNPS
jgi:endonuclease/exonuclease/phosphatase family metal-dependent hydrolase